MMHDPDTLPAFVPAAERSRRYVGLALWLSVPVGFLLILGFLWASYFAVRGLAWVMAVWMAMFGEAP